MRFRSGADHTVTQDHEPSRCTTNIVGAQLINPYNSSIDEVGCGLETVERASGASELNDNYFVENFLRDPVLSQRIDRKALAGGSHARHNFCQFFHPRTRPPINGTIALRKIVSAIASPVDSSHDKTEASYRSVKVDIGCALAITGAPASAEPSSRNTCPACGDCNPILRAMASMRPGSRSDASSSRSA